MISKAARTNALMQQQKLIDDGHKVEVTAYMGFYELHTPDGGNWICHERGIEWSAWQTAAAINDGGSALWLARSILKGRFIEGEPAIAKSADYAYSYAHDVLNGPFPAAEEVLARGAHFAYWYAKYVLKTPFPLAEPFLAKLVAHEELYKLAYCKEFPDRAAKLLV